MTRRAPHPPFTDEHERVRAQMREFIAAELRPHADTWEAAKGFPDELFATVGAAGYFGLKFEPEWGGSATSFADGTLRAALWALELARCGSAGVAAGLGAHSEIAAPPIWTFGTDAQRRRWLGPAIAGELICALGITEPGAGSDVAGLSCRATRVDGGWLVTGEKTYITNGVRFGALVCAVRTGGADRHAGISFMVIERDAGGISTSALDKLGWHASDTAIVALQDVFVPDEHVLGAVDQGFGLIMANFAWERLQMSLGAVGAMEALLEQAIAHRPTATVSERPMAGQTVRHRLAALQVTLETSRALTFDALGRFAHGEDVLRQVTMAKLMTQRAAFEVADGVLQLSGEAGTLETGGPGLARAVRDARLGPIGGGTDEIMAELLGRMLG